MTTGRFETGQSYHNPIPLIQNIFHSYSIKKIQRLVSLTLFFENFYFYF